MVVISVSWKEFQKIDGVCRQDTHSQHTTVQYSLFTSAERTINALGSRASKAQELHCRVCALEKSLVVLCVACLIFGCLTCLSPRALHLPHSLFLLRHKNTQHNWYNKNNSENTQYIPKLPQPTSCAIKNHSGVKTCKVAETRAPQLPQVMSPRSLRLSPESKLILEIHINCMMYMKILTKKITELLSPKKWRNLERLGQPAYRTLKYQRRPTSNRRCNADSDLEDGELQKMLTSPLCAQKSLGKPDASVMQERGVSAQHSQANRQGSLRSHSSEGQKAVGKPFRNVLT